MPAQLDRPAPRCELNSNHGILVCAYLHGLINTGYVIFWSRQYRSTLCALKLTNKEQEATGQAPTTSSRAGFQTCSHFIIVSCIIPQDPFSICLTCIIPPRIPGFCFVCDQSVIFESLDPSLSPPHLQRATADGGSPQKELIFLILSLLLADLASSITPYFQRIAPPDRTFIVSCAAQHHP
ncbi:hypothetical protein BJV78DRAFT_467749 [Lactifluus subvellereus]|nr:hypothetical protein BJV78DRAFT_467749 [Lactifluus subvellereus]